MTLKRTSRVHPPQGDEGCYRHPRAICPVEATSSLTDGALSSDLPTSPSSLLLSMSHLSCRGHVPVVIWWGGHVVPPHVVVVIVCGPFVLRRPCHHHPQVFCPAEASSLSLSLSVLATSLSSSGVSSLSVLVDRPCCIILVIVVIVR